jgi:hypothetical protein
VQFTQAWVSIASWKGQSSMIRRLIATSIGAGLLVGFALVASGCSGDPEQASRESISAPRKGGGVTDTAGEKMKPGAKPKAGKTTPD